MEIASNDWPTWTKPPQNCSNSLNVGRNRPRIGQTSRNPTEIAPEPAQCGSAGRSRVPGPAQILDPESRGARIQSDLARNLLAAGPSCNPNSAEHKFHSPGDLGDRRGRPPLRHAMCRRPPYLTLRRKGRPCRSRMQRTTAPAAVAAPTQAISCECSVSCAGNRFGVLRVESGARLSSLVRSETHQAGRKDSPYAIRQADHAS